MAFRIHDSVERGEMDNRIKGTVRGHIWVAGRIEPIVVELEGNAWPDLAGCLLTFTNTQKAAPLPHVDSLHPIQRGSIGDLTASRKVRVFDVPFDQALEMIRRKEKPPEHIANCLYLEWFSEANGRVVIESADYQLTISPPEWRLTEEEENERAEQAASSMGNFMKRLDDIIERRQRVQKDPDQEWDEFDYEKFLKECDARTDQYMELLDKFGDSPESEAGIFKEMGWDEIPPDGGQLSGQENSDIAEEPEDVPIPEPDPLRQGIDWIRTEHGDIRHPLQHRCIESALKFRRHIEGLGLDSHHDSDLQRFVLEFQATGAKLTGALDDIAHGKSLAEAAFTIALLKRALNHLIQTHAALEAITSKQLLPAPTIFEMRKELFEVREGILNLMNELRGKV